ncbi:Pyruvate decarboxylase [Lecanosticta acicola]|uniref:Pyruvate decarboxylase n=1 Tax=Lecanosticta acicola TaxID=111012 RepID=A0AAI9EBH6_9PEZI|nr:Pyruvate decarboxylase [Lecanosticta acicola]
MPDTIELAHYLFTRLRQLGVGSVHGVPGDYNLTLLDYVEPSGLNWVGNANELNAGYAADGYARVKGVGALITTFGVGELSAINAIAGAYTELAKVIHIVGTPRRQQQESRSHIHHTMLDGEYGHFARMAEHVTTAQANLLDPRTAPQLIDDAIQQCLIHSRPVYIQIPVDMVAAEVSSERLRSPITIPSSISAGEAEKAIALVAERAQASQRPMILVDGESGPYGILNEVHEFIKQSGWPTWITSFAKGTIDETLPNVHGVWQGAYSPPEEQDYIGSADLVLCFGPHFSNTNTYLYTTIPKSETTIYFKATSVDAGDQVFRDLPAKPFLISLLGKLDLSLYQEKASAFTPPPKEPFTKPSPDLPISQSKFYQMLGSRVPRPGDIIMGETGTPGYGVRDMSLPPNVLCFNPITWLSIGYMLPAAQGAALAQRELHNATASTSPRPTTLPRTILIIGDGSFQMTCQELSTIIAKKLNVLIFVLNNQGYTIERCLHGHDAHYNDIPAWNYLDAPAFFGAQTGPEGKGVYGAVTRKARTWRELDNALKAVAEEGSLLKQSMLRMVEVVMDKEDAPKALKDILEATKGVALRERSGQTG